MRSVLGVGVRRRGRRGLRCAPTAGSTLPPSSEFGVRSRWARLSCHRPRACLAQAPQVMIYGAPLIVVLALVASGCASCRSSEEFRWKTDGGITCEGRCPDGSTCLSELTCNRVPDWQCSEAVPVDGGAWRPCWGLGPLETTVGGGAFDGPWGLGAECCCQPSCGNSTVPGRARVPLICSGDVELPQPFSCVDGVVTWPRTSP